jgi:hypothetical protein
MAKNMSGHKPAGGVGSKNIVRPGVRTGAAATGYNPGRVGQIGSALGNHAEHGPVRGDPREAPHTARPAGGEMRLGNEVATNVGKGGPGTGRRVMASGSQGMHGPVNRGNPPPTGDVLAGWRKG